MYFINDKKTVKYIVLYDTALYRMIQYTTVHYEA